MSKKMLFNTTEPEEIRAAIIENDELIEYDIETRTREQNRNNIYRGYIVQIEPSIQAAFVEYGTHRHGFLPFREIHPDFWSKQPPKEQSEDRNLSIEQVLRKGQQVLVQVVREEIDHKGAALTTYCTLPGRYLVLMPRSENGGISRKIEDPSERQSLRKIMKSIQPPEGFGYIIRTAGLGKTETEISRDLDIMVRLWKSIQNAAKHGPRAGLVFKEADLVHRMIRDYHDTDVEEIWIDEPEAFERARNYFSAVMPNMENVVKLYDSKTPVFDQYDIELRLLQLYDRKVHLESGGSIVIDSTEALVAIDVNSGKTQSENTEETAYKTNCEAAREIARQLRLRDLGGLVVIDFIGMRNIRHMRGVERVLRDAVKSDKARIRLGRLTSTFGLLTLSRQRIRDRKELAHFVTCPTCKGQGKFPNTETNALIAYRHLHQLAMQEQYDHINASLPKDVALYLLNHKRSQIVWIEKEYDIQISIRPKDGPTIDLERDISIQLRSNRSKRQKKKEKAPIKLPFEKISNEGIEPSESPSAHESKRSNVLQVQSDKEAYLADGWDILSRERKEHPPELLGAPWFLQHLNPADQAPSRLELAKQYGVPDPVGEALHAEKRKASNHRKKRNDRRDRERTRSPRRTTSNERSNFNHSKEIKTSTHSNELAHSSDKKQNESTLQQSERSERNDRPEKNSRNERDNRSDRRERNNRNERSHRNERSERNDRRERNNRNERTERSTRNEKQDAYAIPKNSPSESSERYAPSIRHNRGDRREKERNARRERRERNDRRERYTSSDSNEPNDPHSKNKRNGRKNRKERHGHKEKKFQRNGNLHNDGLPKRVLPTDTVTHHAQMQSEEARKRAKSKDEHDKSHTNSSQRPVRDAQNSSPKQESVQIKTELPIQNLGMGLMQAAEEAKRNENLSTQHKNGAPKSSVQISSKAPVEAQKKPAPSTAKPPASVWSPEEFARIRNAAQEEHRRLNRWNHNQTAPQVAQPSSNEGGELLHLAKDPAHTGKPEVTVTAPAASTQNKKVLKRPAQGAVQSNNPPRRSRWTEQELEALASVSHLPLSEAKKAFEAKGYQRSLSAFRNRYYNLRTS